MLVGGRPQVLWEGLAGLRGDAPSEARGADGERAGRRPRAHQAARPTRQATRRPEHQRHHKQQNRKARAPEGPTMAPESPENLAAVPVGGGGAWPGFEATQAPTVWREPESPENLAAVPVGGGRARARCWSAAAGPGRASRSTTPSEARVWRSRGRATADQHTQRPGPSRQATRRSKFSRALRYQEHPQRRKQPGPDMRKPRPADAGRGQPTQSGEKV